jgi:hypothetical protein
MHCLAVLPAQANQQYVVFSTFCFCAQPFLSTFSSFVIILSCRCTYMSINVLPYIYNTCVYVEPFTMCYIICGVGRGEVGENKIIITS